MVTNNSTDLSLWQIFLKRSKKIAKSIQKSLREFSQKYPDVSQVIQLTFIYFFAVIDLLYAVLNNVFSLGYLPEVLMPVFPFIKAILQSPILKIWASPEKVFFLSYVVIEFMVVRSTFKFSKLVKYNILLIFALLMVQGLVISYWDLLFHREIANGIQKWILDDAGLIYNDKSLSIFVFFITFLVFSLLYTYLYIRSIKSKFATFPGLAWLTDSIAFWLKIKTPTMRLGFRKKKKGNNK